MRTLIKILSIVLVLVGLTVSIIALASCGFDLRKSEALITESFDITEDFEKIVTDLSGMSCDLTVKRSEGESASIKLCHTERNRISYGVKDGVLTVKSDDQRRWYDKIMNFTTLSVTLSLPEKDFDSLTHRGTSGDVRISDLSLGSLDIDTTSGDIYLRSVNATKAVSLECTSGECEIEKLCAAALTMDLTSGDFDIRSLCVTGDVKINATSSDIEIENADIGSLLINATSSDIELAGLKAGSAVNLEATSGEIELKEVIVGDKLTVDTTSGDITLIRSDAASYYLKSGSGDVEGSILTRKNFKASSTSGSAITPDSDYTAGICEIKTTSGDIRISLAN